MALTAMSGDMPPIPDTETFVLVRPRRRACTSRSEMNDAEDPLSSRALTHIDEPSGAVTFTWQVINNEYESCLVVAALAKTAG